VFSHHLGRHLRLEVMLEELIGMNFLSPHLFNNLGPVSLLVLFLGRRRSSPIVFLHLLLPEEKCFSLLLLFLLFFNLLQLCFQFRFFFAVELWFWLIWAFNTADYFLFLGRTFCWLINFISPHSCFGFFAPNKVLRPLCHLLHFLNLYLFFSFLINLCTLQLFNEILHLAHSRIGNRFLLHLFFFFHFNF
jgi:hypothetical protein